MEQETVAYLGPKASYTHQTAFSVFSSSSSSLIPCTTIEDVFEAVHSGAAQYGVVPFENSTHGPVVTTLDLFATSLGTKSGATVEENSRRQFDGIRACRDVFTEVRHCLLAKANSNGNNENAEAGGHPVNGTLLANVKRVQSHEQAIGQCKTFLSTRLKHVEKKEVSSTSKAAELAAADPTGQTAAISSEMAAEIYGLQILQRGIQDRKDNVTRFLILQRTGDATPPRSSSVNGDSQRSNYKALIIFTVSHTSPGTLADSLAVFKQHDVNVTSINTRPNRVAPWNYYFFIEVAAEAGKVSGKARIDDALVNLEKVANSWRSLGGWAY